MKRQRGWLLGIAVVLLSLLVGGRVRTQGATMRWDIISIPNFNPVTIQPGGQSTALAADGSRIRLNGGGTFVLGEPDNVTGGGTWITEDVQGLGTGFGQYQVTGLIRFTEAPGALPPPAIDHSGKKEDVRAGLAFLRIAFSDGSRGILVVSCRLPVQSPLTMPEGTSVSKGFVFFAMQAPRENADDNRTNFHVLR
jgi:hypothetical protein